MKANKKKYVIPEMGRIGLDNEISLILTSEAPPAGPGESIGQAPEYFNLDSTILS